MVPPVPPPVPWSLAWRDDGELASQDRFDLLQTMVLVEAEANQPGLVLAMERLSLSEITTLSTGGLTGLCA